MTRTLASRGIRRNRSIALSVVVFLAAIALPVQAQDDGICITPGFNAQCTEFGAIQMENQRDIKGEPITMTITSTVANTYEDEGARWMLFSVRHVPEFGSSPVSLSVEGFSSEYGDVYITDIEQDVPNELNLWVHVVDVPVDTPIDLDVGIGAADRGAFRLEALIMPFDRGYDPIADEEGNDRILYTFSLLGVNGETAKAESAPASSSGGGSSRFTPGLGVVMTAALLGAAVMMRRRSA